MNAKKMLIGFAPVLVALALAGVACKKQEAQASSTQGPAAAPAAPAAAAPATAQAGDPDAWYVCPMEECQVWQKCPARCPKCGMNLAPAPEGCTPQAAKTAAPAVSGGEAVKGPAGAGSCGQAAAGSCGRAAGGPSCGHAGAEPSGGPSCGCAGRSAGAEGVGTAKDLAADKIGQQATCPVTGETFTVQENTPAVKLGEQVYLFCCAGCAPRFLAEPEKYGAPAAPAAATPAVEIKTAASAPELGNGDLRGGRRSYTVSAETPAIAWEGKVHLFGCMGCANAFAANPANPQHPQCGSHGEH